MLTLLLLGATAARAEVPLMVLHLDPGVTAAAGVPPEPALGAKVEFPLAWFVMHTAPAFLCMLGGKASVGDVLEPAPPITPLYELYARRGLDPEDRLDWGGGLGLRFRPLAGIGGLGPTPRGLWVDLDGRYGSAGWGLDGGVGWDLPLGSVVAVGPALSGVWDQRALWGAASLTLSFSFDGRHLGGEVTLPAE